MASARPYWHGEVLGASKLQEGLIPTAALTPVAAYIVLNMKSLVILH